MANKKYRLQYLPLFEQDLIQTASYITNVLRNPDAAKKLLDDVETAILERLNNPLAFESYPSAKKRKYTYYRIYVRNYVICYVVIDDVMEVRRFLYGARDIYKNVGVLCEATRLFYCGEKKRNITTTVMCS